MSNNNTKEIQEKNIAVPTIIVIFGITGDLARNKLIPALLDLYTAKVLPDNFKIIGFSRRDFKKADFIDYLTEVIDERQHNHDKNIIDGFLEHFEYCPALFEEPSAYKRLGEVIYDIEKNEFGVCANKLYHLAVPPAFYESIFHQLAQSGLTLPCGGDKGWSRVLVEKPFGHNIETARKLDELLGKLFDETQIFRIDHYLAKETVQNILAFRFSNALFEPLWDNKHIQSISIELLETKTIGERGLFYDGIGALRDVGQNHLLQMLGLITMEIPKNSDSDSIRTARADVFDSLECSDIDTDGKSTKCTVRGQYKGYLDEKGVEPDSQIETYFKLSANIKNKRWRGVPIKIESGKALNTAKAEITICFKRPEYCLCMNGMDGKRGKKCEHNNTLTFRIQPDEGISLRFWIKKPGLGNELQEKTLSFNYNGEDESDRLPDAYERLLHDALRGDQTLFASTDEVLCAWNFITPILNSWAKDKDKLIIYEQGSNVEQI